MAAIDAVASDPELVAAVAAAAPAEGAAGDVGVVRRRFASSPERPRPFLVLELVDRLPGISLSVSGSTKKKSQKEASNSGHSLK